MMMLSALMTTGMNIIIKIQSSKTEVNVIQAIVLRNVFLAFGCWLHMIKDNVSILDVPRPLFKLLLLRGLFGFMSTMGLYLAIDFLPLSLAITIYYTQPIIVAIVCYLVLGEKLGKLEILSIFSAMFGVILLTYPELIFPSLTPHHEPLDDLSSA
jgi:drug/metabolite transporter (DMT)-like permease